MLKLIGILTGSALAVAFLIVALGVPDFSAPAPAQEVIAVVGEAPPGPVTDPLPDPPMPAPGDSGISGSRTRMTNASPSPWQCRIPKP